ncbi:uncharacterized mitochondrial protein AtMg00240-like [Nicotiana tomentosiformis]|uniref:uncharacterized mitochondrial protein AtMg00240-like n=1 Tax=Nicotiana tomentosiformis TaxID=4098 RepID=UPI00388C5F3E
MTRPDLSFSVQTLSQFLQQPKISHMEATMRIVKYIKNQPGRGILLSSTNKNIITTYCDADWVACPFSRKSVTRYLIKIGDSLVSWKSKKQTTGLMQKIGIEVNLPIEVYRVSKAAMQIVAIPVYHERTKTVIL